MMLVNEILVRKFLPIDRLTPSPVSFGEVAALRHKTRDHSVEETAFEVKSLTALPLSILARTELVKVLRGFRSA